MRTTKNSTKDNTNKLRDETAQTVSTVMANMSMDMEALMQKFTKKINDSLANALMALETASMV